MTKSKFLTVFPAFPTIFLFLLLTGCSTLEKTCVASKDSSQIQPGEFVPCTPGFKKDL